MRGFTVAVVLLGFTGPGSMADPVGVGPGPANGVSPQNKQRVQAANRSVWTIQHQLLTRIRGLAVENRDGQFLGYMDDLILDERSGAASFGVVSCGGLLGLGKTYKAVPAALFSTATAKVGVVSLDVGRRRWDRAPLFEKRDLAALNRDASGADGLYRYYGVFSRPIAVANSFVRAGDKTERNRFQGARFDFASELLKRNVIDQRDQPVGRILNLLLDFSNRKPTLAIVSAIGERKPGRFAVSLSSLVLQRQGTMQIQAVPQSLAQAPALDDNAWQAQRAGQAGEIYRFQ